MREPPIPTWTAAPAPECVSLNLIFYFLSYTQIRSSRVHVTSDVIVPGEQGQQIIAAEIGEPGSPRPQSPGPKFSKSRSSSILRSRPLSLTISRNSRTVHPGGLHPSSWRARSTRPLCWYKPAKPLRWRTKRHQRKRLSHMPLTKLKLPVQPTQTVSLHLSKEFWDLMMGKHDENYSTSPTTLMRSTPKRIQNGRRMQWGWKRR